MSVECNAELHFFSAYARLIVTSSFLSDM